MKNVRMLRLPLLTLVLLATLLMTSSAFAAKPVAKEVKTHRQVFSSYMENHAGGGCMYSEMSSYADD